jgi:hypothetical protein
MRSLTIVMPLIAFLVALTQGLFLYDMYDAGADPQVAQIIARRKQRVRLRRLTQQKDTQLTVQDHSLSFARRP